MFVKKGHLILGLTIVAICFFILGVIAFVKLESVAERKVRLLRDIDLKKDCAFSQDNSELIKLDGVIKKGSIGLQTFRKGPVVYLHFSTVLDASDVEYLENGKPLRQGQNK